LGKCSESVESDGKIADDIVHLRNEAVPGRMRQRETLGKSPDLGG